MRTECCNVRVSRLKETARHAWFVCWLCGFLQRIKFSRRVGLEGVEADII